MPFDREMLSGYPVGTSVAAAGGEGLDGFRIVADSGTLRLYYNPRTAETAVMDVASGVVYRSNPPGFPAGRLGAQLLLTVYSDKGVRYTWDSNSQAVAFGQFCAAEMPGGLAVTYVFGRTEAEYAVPGAVKVGTFERVILPMLEGTSGATFVKLLYSKVSLKAVSSPQQRQALLERFPSLESTDLYVLKNNASRLELERAEKTLTEAGYTLARKQKDEADGGFRAQAAEQVHVRISLSYALTDTGLLVRVPAGEIAVGGGASVTDVTVLPYFGSPGDGTAGFALVPDGMGALIDFSARRDDAYPTYEARVYGRDYANLLTDSSSEGSQVYLPAFGLHQGAGALTAVCMGGTSYASVVADAPRAGGSPGYCAFKFLLQESALYSLDAKPENRVAVFQRRANKEELSISYRFRPGGEATYSDMAAAIRQELIEGRALPESRPAGSPSLPLVLEGVGAIDVTELVLGIPVNVTRPLTTFEQMGELAVRLQDAAGARELHLIVAGGGAGGLRSTREIGFTPERKLGGEPGFEKLRQAIGGRGISLAVALSGQQVMRDKGMDGFRAPRDAARLLSSAIAYKPEHTLSTMYQDTKGLSAYLLNPDAVRQTVSSFVRSAEERGVRTFALSTLGRDLYSDQNRGSFVSREEMMSRLTELLASQVRAGSAFLSDGANSYLLPSVTLAYGLPMEASPHPLKTQEVPLLQMVLSGHIPYAAGDLHYANDAETYLLRMVETGSGLYLTGFAAPGSAVKYTDFDALYASSFDPSLRVAAEIYRKAAEVLAPVRGREMVCHERRGDIVRTGYTGGGAVYVNYGREDAVVDWGGESFLLRARTALLAEEAEACTARD